MHEAALSRAVLPAPTICLGLLLRPFSLGHCLWLTRENTSQVDDVRSLATAVWICCQSWRENLNTRNDRLINLKLWVWKRRLRKFHFETELARFHAYIAEGSMEFPISDVERPDRPRSPRYPGCPMILRLQQWVMLSLRKTEEEAWDYPIGLAKMRWAAHWEQEGGLEIQNQHEAEFDRFVAEQEAKGAAALKGEKV